MRNTLAVVAGSAAMMIVYCNAAQAESVRINYNYSGIFTVYPTDDGPGGSQISTSGSGSKVFNIPDLSSFGNTSTDAVVVSNPSDGSSIQVFNPNPFTQQGLGAAIFGSGGVTFEYDYVDTSSAIFGTHTFSAGINDFYSIGFAGGGRYKDIDPETGLGFSQDATGSLSGSFTISQLSTVPLPASAPLFGAALLVLGAAGYGMRRKKIVAV